MKKLHLTILKFFLGILIALSIVANIRSFFVIESLLSDIRNASLETYSENLKVRKLLEEEKLDEAKKELDEQIMISGLLLTIERVSKDPRFFNEK